MSNELILVCDDEEMLRKIAGRILLRAGYNVLFAESGVESIEVFREHSKEIKLVLLDLYLPDISGTDVFIELKKINGAVPVLIVTGTIDDALVLKAEELGINGIVKKPYAREILLERVSGTI